MESNPMEADSIEADPMEANPIEADPMEANPLEANPLEANPLEANPLEADFFDSDCMFLEPVKSSEIAYDERLPVSNSSCFASKLKRPAKSSEKPGDPEPR